jgi:AraC-like DNA-binding protein
VRDTIRFVPEARPDHDREAGAPDRSADPAPHVLQDALERLRLQGAIFLRGEYCEPWEYESFTAPETVRVLRPGAERLILFHVVASGTCWVRVGEGERHWARAGDVIVLPYGDQHHMGGTLDAESVPMSRILQPPPWLEPPVIRHGADGARTDVVCGYLHSTDLLFDPELRVFPPVFVVRPPEGPAADWVRAGVQYALQITHAHDGHAEVTEARLPELLLVEVLRLHLASAPAADDGWLAALHDPVLRPALALLHAEPDRRWTVSDLARESAVSRSVLDARFREVLGRSPMRYVTEWRMHVAEDLLVTTDLPVGAIGRRVGYDAEEAFSRAFKRSHGSAPSVWRSGHPLR